MRKNFRAMKKKKQHKFFKRTKLGIGLLAGGVLGMLYAPKKGREIRDYFKSDEFKNRLGRAQKRAEETKEYVKDKALDAKSGFNRFWTALRKRFGM